MSLTYSNDKKNQQHQELGDTFVQVLLADLKACSKTGNLKRGKLLHAKAAKCGHDSNIYVVNALIHMYAKCGRMVDARRVFDSVKHPTIVSWNTLILGYAANGEGLTSLNLFTSINYEGPPANSVTFLAALKACTSLTANGANGCTECRHRCKVLHDLAIENGCVDIYVRNTLIDVYAKCGSMEDARQVFDSMKHPSVVSWNVLILGYAENGQGLIALELFGNMINGGLPPDSSTFVAALKACASLAENGWDECRDEGKRIHDLAVKSRCETSRYVQNTLIDMYARCRSMVDARHVFDRMGQPDVVSWNALILGYADNGQGIVAVDLFMRMRNEGPAPDHVTILAALKACTSLALEGGDSGREECMHRGNEVHRLAVENGLDLDIYVQSTLIDMYVKCGCMKDARLLFDSIIHPNVACWNVMILGYAANGQGLIALDTYIRMRKGGPEPDFVTFAAVVKTCAVLGALEFGRKIHLEIETRNHVNSVLVNSLVDFYAKCGSLVEAQSVFDLYPETRGVITWTSLLAGFSNCGDHKTVFSLFQAMQDAGFKPTCVTFLSVLMCCNHAGLVEKGIEYFESMSTKKFGILPTVEHYTCMLDIFGRANKLDDAIALVQRMSCNANNVTWLTVMSACLKWKNVEIGRLAFQSLIYFNDRNASAYVLMGQIFGSRGMLQEQEMMMGMRKMCDIFPKHRQK